MNTYKISSYHTVFAYSYLDGCRPLPNNVYLLDHTDEFKDVRKAIEHYVENVMFWKLDWSTIDINEDGTDIFISCIVDQHNNEPSSYEIDRWKKNELTLYSNDASIIVEKLERINLSEELIPLLENSHTKK